MNTMIKCRDKRDIKLPGRQYPYNRYIYINTFKLLQVLQELVEIFCKYLSKTLERTVNKCMFAINAEFKCVMSQKISPAFPQRDLKPKEGNVLSLPNICGTNV